MLVCLSASFVQNLVSTLVDFGVAVAKLVAEDSGVDTTAPDFMDNVRQGVTEVFDFESQLAQVRAERACWKHPV